MEFQYKNSTYRLVYRRYAGLYFGIVCDISDNPLSILEVFDVSTWIIVYENEHLREKTLIIILQIIHLFVEILDNIFGNVCELDLVFNFNKVYCALDEMLLAGEIQVDIDRKLCVHNYTSR